MPILACRICGRRVDTSSRLDSFVPEEGRCPRCGARLQVERRAGDRRQAQGGHLPDGAVARPDGAVPPAGTGERRLGGRRSLERRRDRPSV